MARYQHIRSACFDGLAIGHVESVHLLRIGQAMLLGSDAARFLDSVQCAAVETRVEIRSHDIDLAEALSIGQLGQIELEVGPASSGQTGRVVRVSGAVLQSIELDYPRARPPQVVLRFVVEAAEGAVDPVVDQAVSV